MAKKATTAKKTTKAAKTSTKAKATTKTKVSKGDSLVCEVCGLSLVVEEVGGIAIGEVRPIICCSKPMKKKAKKPKTIKATKTTKTAKK